MAYKSIVDYMTANKMDAGYNNRAKLAKQYGIKHYAGTASQNVALLGYLQKGGTKTTTKPSKNTTQVKPPKISSQDQAWYNNYSKTIQSGTANSASYKHYQALQKKYGLKNYTIANDALHNLSIKALSGDKQAAAYLKAFHITAQDAKHGLWKGFDTNTIGNNNALNKAYRKDNPYAQFTKTYENGRYNTYNDMILNNKQMTADQMAYYKKLTDKWNLDDMNDPYNKHAYQLNKDKQTALDAQSTALNQSLAQQNANDFQQFQQLQQNMNDRGITDSGIAADAYVQAQNLNNQNYSQMYADAATQKSDITTSYNDKIAGVREDQLKNQQDQQVAANKNTIDLLNAQTTQDKYLTTSTGKVYLNGKVLKYGGKEVTSMEYNKLNETQRHNMANENNIAIKNQQTYDISTKKITADLQKSIAKNELDYAKLDYNYAKLEANNKANQAKIKIAAENAQSTKDRNQLTALGKQADQLSSQIVAYQKRGDKPPKKLVDKYNKTNRDISKLVGGKSFQNDTKGDGKVNYKNSYNGNPSSFGGYRQYGHQPKSYNTHLSAAIKKGVPASWAKQMTELVGRESGFSYKAQNPTSTAHGYGQFLNGTVASYRKRYPNLDYSNPVDQLVLMYHYIKDRYGTPEKALIKWEQRSPHWY